MGAGRLYEKDSQLFEALTFMIIFNGSCRQTVIFRTLEVHRVHTVSVMLVMSRIIVDNTLEVNKTPTTLMSWEPWYKMYT